MVVGDVVDKLHDERGLAHAGAAEEANLSPSGVGRQQVDDLDAGFEKFGHGRQAGKGGRLSVNLGNRRLNGPQLVDGAAQHVHHAAQHGLAHRHADAVPRVFHKGAAAHAFGGLQRNAAHHAGRRVGRHLHMLAVGADEQITHPGRLALKLHVKHRASDFDNHALAVVLTHCMSPPSDSASAAPVISAISDVMALWRAM